MVSNVNLHPYITEMAFVSHILCKDEAHCKDLHSHLLVYDTYKKLDTAFGLMARGAARERRLCEGVK